MASRTIVKIDETLCDGCGECIPSCAEGALMIIGGVAKLVNDKYCDGMGSCLGVCPQGAITLEERDAEEFDVSVVPSSAIQDVHSRTEGKAAGTTPPPAVAQMAAPSCPGSMQHHFATSNGSGALLPVESNSGDSLLQHWPVQLGLLQPGAAFLQNADLLLTADCVPFAYRSFHADFLPGHAIAIACPKLDNPEGHLQKLTAIFSQTPLKSITIVRMEVPCCGGLNRMVAEAMQRSGARLTVREVVISIHGEKLGERTLLAG